MSKLLGISTGGSVSSELEGKVEIITPVIAFGEARDVLTVLGKDGKTYPIVVGPSTHQIGTKITIGFNKHGAPKAC